MAGVIDVTVHRPGQQVVHRQWQAPVLCSEARDDLKEEFGSGILCSGGSTVAVSRSAQLAPDQTYEYRVFPPRPAAGASSSTPAEAGAAAEAEDAAAAVTIQSRVPHTSRYASHICGSNGANEAAVVVGPFHVATYHHQGHVHWSKGQEVQVCVHAGGSDTPCSIMGTVDYVDDRVDLVLIKVSEQLAAPVLDAQLSPGQRYFVLGQSAQAQGDASSVSHGIIAATQPDELSHVRGDIQVGRSDSGAGCFAVQTRRLIGMVVGVDAATHKSVLVPGAVLAYALSRVTAAA